MTSKTLQQNEKDMTDKLPKMTPKRLKDSVARELMLLNTNNLLLDRLEAAKAKINHQKGALINASEEIEALGKEREALEYRHEILKSLYEDVCNLGADESEAAIDEMIMDEQTHG